MRKDNVAHSIVAKHRKIADETDQLPVFFDERFEVFTPNPYSTIISGSSIGYPHIDYVESNLDAAATAFITDKNGLITEIRMATADGLGDSRTDHAQNAAIRHAAHSASSDFCKQSSSLNIPQQLLAVCDNTKLSAKNKSVKGEAALAGAIVKLSKDKIESSFVNVGDTMIVVLDGTNFSVKTVVSPQVVAHGINGWSPLSLQQFRLAVLRGYPTVGAQFTDTATLIKSGDYIIQMTDGAWSELGSTEVSYSQNKERWMEFQIDCKSFSKVIQEGVKANKAEDVPVSFKIAQVLIEKILSHTLDQRCRYNVLFNKIQKYLTVTDNKLTVIDWLETFDDVEVSKELKTYLFDVQHDGICFSEMAEAYIVVKWLKEYCFGDCTTVSVTQVPDRDIELLRSLVESPENAASILPQIANELRGKDLKSLFNRLRNETYLSKPEMATKLTLENFNTKKIYSDDELAIAECLTKCYLNIETHIKASNFAAIADLYRSQPMSAIVYLHNPVINMLEQKKGTGFTHRLLNFSLNKEIAEQISVLSSIFNVRTEKEDFNFSINL